MGVIPWGPMFVAGISVALLGVLIYGSYLYGTLKARESQADEAKKLAENLLATRARLPQPRVSSEWLRSGSPRAAQPGAGATAPSPRST